MIRVIVRTDCAGMAINVGAELAVQFKTFEVSAPELESFLLQQIPSHDQRSIVGVELVQEVA